MLFLSHILLLSNKFDIYYKGYDFNDNADFGKYDPKFVGDQFTDFRELQEEEVTKMIRQSKTKTDICF